MTVSLSNRRMSGSIGRLLAVAALGLGGLVIAGTAGAQDAAECGTYGPACPTGSDSGGDATGTGGLDTGGPDSDVSPDSANADDLRRLRVSLRWARSPRLDTGFPGTD